MKISVIIPCYNAAAYLHKCIDSVLAQTIGKDSLEIICIDDHSKDNTREILQEYEHRYPAIFIIILLDENRKQGYARNVGLEYASGEYITFVDADDWISPVMLKTMCELADQHPYREKSVNDRTCILGGYDVIEAGSCKVSSEREEAPWKSCKEVSCDIISSADTLAKRKYILHDGGNTAVWGRLYRRDFILENEIFFPEDIYMEDIFFSQKRMLLMKSCLKIHADLYMYRINPNGIMHSECMVNYYMDTFRVQDISTRLWLQEGLLTDCRLEFMILHFTKAAVEPLMRMQKDERYFSYEAVQQIREEITELFPDFWDNPYLRMDSSQKMDMNMYLEVLKTDRDERELRHFFYSAESAHPVRTMASCAEQKRKVVEVLIAVAEKGGVENAIKIMLRELESSQLHFRIVQMVWEGYRWLDESIEFHPLLEGRHGHSLQEFADTYAAFEKDVKEPPDLIIAVGWPYLCTVAHVAVDCFGWKTKVISWLHSDIERYDAAGYGGREALQDADGHLAISTALQKSLEKISSADRVYRVKNPVDLPQVGLETEMGQQESLHRNLIYVGRVSKEKNIGFLLQCIQALPTWKLDIVGEGQERKKLQEIAVAIGVENRVHWLGWQEEPWQYAVGKDALILSSFYEGFPLTAIEAMSRGLPVISTAVGGIEELVEEGVTGWLYDTRQMRTLLDVLHRMEELGRTGSSRAACIRRAAEYDSGRVMAQMKDILLRLMS